MGIPEYIELGQYLFATNTQNLEAPEYISDGLVEIAEAIAKKRHDEMLLTDNSGENDYISPVFSMRSYCWCEGSVHKDGCPPNFEHISGLVVSWYKHAWRGVTMNKTITEQEWGSIAKECVQQVEARP